MPGAVDIDSVKLRRTVLEVLRLLAAKDYQGLFSLSRGVRLSAADIARAIHEYDRTIVDLPDAEYDRIDVIAVSDSSPQRWSVDVGLWTAEEGSSDLTLSLSLEDSPGEIYKVEIDDLHVL